jgi:nicotinamidase-related amidase
MQRTADMIRRIGPKLDDIHVTLDSHQMVQIERPAWWKHVTTGDMPAPFTVLGLTPDNRIVAVDMSSGSPVLTNDEYTTFAPSLYDDARAYLKALSDGGRYPHVVWTNHCVVGTWGWGIVPDLADALCKWEVSEKARINYVVKGNNPNTEHFSGVRAEVPDPNDPSTQVNTGLISTLEEADMIAVTGEALSHCVANTVRDIADLFSDPKYVEKLVLLTDASSNVGGFDFLGDAFMADMLAKGMKTSTTVDFLA